MPFFISARSKECLIFFDVPDGDSIGCDDPFRIRISVEEPILEMCPEVCRIPILQKWGVAGKVLEKAFPQDQDFVLWVVPGLCIANIMVSEAFDSRVNGVAENLSCIGVVFRLEAYIHDNVGLFDIRMHQVVRAPTFAVFEILSFEAMAKTINSESTP